MEKDRDDIRQEIKIEPFTIVHDILINWWVILLGAIAAALLTYVLVSVRYVPQYSSSATFAVSSRGNSNAMNNLSSTNEMAQTFEKILQSNVMEKVICEKLEIEEVDSEISTEVIEGTNLLILTVIEDSPKEAIDLIHVIMDNYSNISYYTVGDAVMQVLEEPEIPFYPQNPLNVKEDMKKTFLYAVVFLIALIGLISYMRDTIKREEDVEEKLDARNLGIISYTRKYKTLKETIVRKKGALLVTNPLAEFGFVEGYKKLATKIDYHMLKENRKVLVVTSVSENEGKSTVASNLAITLAEQSKRVLLIDGDLRRPSQFLIFGKNPKEENELGEFLKGNTGVKSVIWKSGIPNLYLTLGKNCYSSSTEVLQSDNLRKLLELGKKSMDYVIIDSPPAGLMGDAEVLADYADAVMVVVKQHYMHAEDINDVLDSFRAHHSKVLGVVLNEVRTFSDMPIANNYGKYGKYGKYGRYGRYGNYNRTKGTD